MEDGAIA